MLPPGLSRILRILETSLHPPHSLKQNEFFPQTGSERPVKLSGTSWKGVCMHQRASWAMSSSAIAFQTSRDKIKIKRKASWG